MVWITDVVVDGFWSKVDRRGAEECWPWTGARSHFGHGYFRVLRAENGAHRVAYELANGAVPEGLCVLHSCDNPPCCNPAHLRLGTRTDNAQDRIERRRGRGRPRVLTNAQAAEIRQRASVGDMSASALARSYGVGRGSIDAILRGETYREVLPLEALAGSAVMERELPTNSEQTANQPGRE